MSTVIPYGFSKFKDRQALQPKTTVFVKFPIFIYYDDKYDITNDVFKTGWWKFSVLLSFDKLKANGFGFRINYGWTLR